MFGHDDQLGQQDSNAIPDQSIEGAMSGEVVAAQTTVSAPAVQTVQPSAASAPDHGLTDDVPANSPAPTATDFSAPAPAATDANTLIDIKQQALTQLSPLVGHLDQTPEEKFRTTMMMIQASDDQSLIKTAFEAAQNITDEKSRAQALLDIVNEINYFTQQHEG